jgi:hypothetical protein
MSFAIRPIIFLVGSTGILLMLIAAWAAETLGNLSRTTTHDSFRFLR